MKLIYKRISAVLIVSILVAVVVYGVAWKIEKRKELHVVINEFYPWKEGDPRPGWIELYNPTDEKINITYWKFWYPGIYCPLSPWMYGLHYIYPHEYLLLGGNETLIRKYWNVPDDVRIVEMPPIAEPTSPSFCTSLRIEAVSSLGEVGETVDEVPRERPLLSPGHSWARYRGEYGVDNFTANFYDESEPTPGYENHRVKENLDALLYLFVGLAVAGIVAVGAAVVYRFKIKREK